MKQGMKYTVATLALALPAVAGAQTLGSSYNVEPVYQPYIAAQAGLSSLSDADISSSAPASQEVSFDSGYGISLKAGVQVNQLRIEGQIQYTENDLDEIKANLGGVSVSESADGDVSATAFTANVIWVLMPKEKFHPYIGAGAGLAEVSINGAQANGVALADDSDTVFAYQLMAGVELEVAPRTALYAGYHYLATSDPEFEDSTGAAFETEYASHNLDVGVRYTF